MFILTLAHTSRQNNVGYSEENRKKGTQTTCIPRTANNKTEFNLLQMWVHMGIIFPYFSECHRQIPFLETMSLDYALSQMVLMKENKTKVFVAQRVGGPSKELEQIIQIY